MGRGFDAVKGEEGEPNDADPDCRRFAAPGHAELAFLRVDSVHRRQNMRYRVLIDQDEDGVFVAEVPSLPGCVTQGVGRDEAVSNVRESIAGYLESLESHGDPVPLPIDEEIVEV
jgi:predicted RNase H-like HicB family nuclease